jgi:hypothetical protein
MEVMCLLSSLSISLMPVSMVISKSMYWRFQSQKQEGAQVGETLLGRESSQLATPPFGLLVKGKIEL